MTPADADRIELVNTLNDALLDIAQRPLEGAEDVSSEIIEILVDQGAYINVLDDDGVTPLSHAISAGNMFNVKAIIECGGNVNAQNLDGWSPLMSAVSSKNMDMIKYLITKGANIHHVNKDGFSCFDAAQSVGFVKGYEYLFEKKMDLRQNSSVDKDIWSFFNAINSCDEEGVSRFIGNGINVNSLDRKGSTALARACLSGNYNNVLALINANADIDLPGKNTFTPIHYAIANGNEEIVRLLLNCNVDLEQQDSVGYTALSAAVFNGRENIIQMLLRKGCDIEKRDSRNLTARELAVFLGKKDIVRLLEINGAHVEHNSHISKGAIVENQNLENMNQYGPEYFKDFVLGALNIDNLVLNDDGSEIFEKTIKILAESGKFRSSQDLNNFIRLSSIRSIIRLTYDKHSASGIAKGAIDDVIEKLISEADHFEKKDDILRIIKAIKSDDKIDLPEKHYAKIYRAPYSDHGAYCCVVYNHKDQPTRINYCDGNNSNIIGYSQKDTKYTYGAFYTKIDRDKITAITAEDKDWLSEFFHDIGDEYQDSMKDGGEKILNAFRKISKTNSNDEMEIKKSILMQPQRKDNCASKAINIVLREMLRLMDSTMVFSKDGRPGGKGYEIYKTYKSFITTKPVEETIDFVDSHVEKEDFTYGVMVRCIQDSILPQAIDKNDENILGKMVNAFGAEFINQSCVGFGKINKDLESRGKRISPASITALPGVSTMIEKSSCRVN